MEYKFDKKWKCYKISTIKPKQYQTNQEISFNVFGRAPLKAKKASLKRVAFSFK